MTYIDHQGVQPLLYRVHYLFLHSADQHQKKSDEEGPQSEVKWSEKKHHTLRTCVLDHCQTHDGHWTKMMEAEPEISIFHSFFFLT